MDFESPRTRSLGCWDGIEACTTPINRWTLPVNQSAGQDFEPYTGFCNFLIDIGFGKDCDPAVRKEWTKLIKENYRGDDGRRRARMAAINLRERDGLHGRLGDVKCPVLWLHVRFPLLFQYFPLQTPAPSVSPNDLAPSIQTLKSTARLSNTYGLEPDLTYQNRAQKM